MAKEQALKTIQTEFTVQQSDLDRITASSGSNSQTVVKQLIEYFLHNYAQGGVMLTPPEMARISKACGKTVRETKDIVGAVEGATGFEKGVKTYRIIVDPAFIAPLEDEAKQRGWTMEQLLNDCFDIIMNQGWLYAVSPGNQMLMIKQDDRTYLEDVLGTPVIHGTDVVNALKAARKDS